eukprot:1159347-Pelagomonas_calceolata.AAC.2
MGSIGSLAGSGCTTPSGGPNSKSGVKILRFARISSQTLTRPRSPPVTGNKIKSSANERLTCINCHFVTRDQRNVIAVQSFTHEFGPSGITCKACWQVKAPSCGASMGMSTYTHTHTHTHTHAAHRPHLHARKDAHNSTGAQTTLAHRSACHQGTYSHN